ncbi:MAG: hypothetical protein R3A10_01880 [Caldilineaceae bacterium]
MVHPPSVPHEQRRIQEIVTGDGRGQVRVETVRGLGRGHGAFAGQEDRDWHKGRVGTPTPRKHVSSRSTARPCLQHVFVGRGPVGGQEIDCADDTRRHVAVQS